MSKELAVSAELEKRLSQVDTILFDLDGTLLGCDINLFLQYYLQTVAARVAGAGLAEPKAFMRQLLASTQAMVDNLEPTITNASAFADSFYPALSMDQAKAEPVFRDFYTNDFPKLRAHTYVKPAARRLLTTAASRGYGLVLATNPLFPLVAIEERMRWAEVFDFPWRLVTAYESMHFCKPHPEYYREILDLIERKPDQCLMVGNDVEEDLVAGSLGITTFLDRSQLIQRGSGPSGADLEGSLDDLLKLVARLPGPAAAGAAAGVATNDLRAAAGAETAATKDRPTD